MPYKYMPPKNCELQLLSTCYDSDSSSDSINIKFYAYKLKEIKYFAIY